MDQLKETQEKIKEKVVECNKDSDASSKIKKESEIDSNPNTSNLIFITTKEIINLDDDDFLEVIAE